MGRVITTQLGSYLVLPRENALLYAEFEPDHTLRLVSDPEYSIVKVASQGVHANRICKDIFEGEGQMLFSVSPAFHRGKVDRDKVSIASAGLEKSLEETDNVNTYHDAITELAENIRGQMDEADKYNPYALCEGINDWIDENIEYTILPKYIIKHVAKTINGLSGEERIEPYKILRYTFNERDDVLQRVASQVHLPPSLRESEDYAIAKELMGQVDSVWRFFQFFWMGEGETSALKTLEEKAGKCVGITNLFLALSRNLGIPSRNVGGYSVGGDGFKEGGHAWAASHMHPYGWIEVDPTNHELSTFDMEYHAYDFSFWNENLPRFTMIDRDKEGCDGKRNDIIHLLEEDTSWYDRFFRTRKHQAEIGFLRSLNEG